MAISRQDQVISELSKEMARVRDSEWAKKFLGELPINRNNGWTAAEIRKDDLLFDRAVKAAIKAGFRSK
jgi:hypothetical protein